MHILGLLLLVCACQPVSPAPEMPVQDAEQTEDASMPTQGAEEQMAIPSMPVQDPVQSSSPSNEKFPVLKKGFTPGFTLTEPVRMEDSFQDYFTASSSLLVIRGTLDASVKQIVVLRRSQTHPQWTATPLAVASGRKTWSYIASAERQTLEHGSNHFIIRAYLQDDSMMERTLIVGGHFPYEQVAVTAGNIPVAWHSPIRIKPEEFFRDIGQLDQVQRSIAGSIVLHSDSDPTSDFVAQQIDLMQVHRVGNVTDGPYKNGEVVVYDVNCADVFDWPCQGYYAPSFRLIVLPDQRVIMLSAYSKEVYQFPLPHLSVVEDAEARLDIDLPATVTIPGSSYILTKIGTSHEMVSETKKSLLFHSDILNKDVFSDEKTGCILIENNDGTTSMYEISYAPKPVEQLPTPAPTDHLSFTVTWNDGTTSNAEYSHGVFGCDPRKACYSVVQVEGKSLLKDGKKFPLEKVGALNTGEAVYREVYSPQDLRNLMDQFRDLKQVYELFYTEGPKPTPEEFYADRPVIYFQDPFGRWLRWLKEDFIPAAECGKPVIYLYPTATTMVDVRVEPNRGFTLTIPPYDNGWRVQATPESVLTTADGTQYPYLFWEGITENYAVPEEGILMERESLPATLDATLERLGLNDKERADFLEFWVPKMQEKPYYIVTFLPQQLFDRLAPLTVTPTPDTIIRVFMDYRGVDAPVAVTPLSIRTPKRRGFTVVEWGGALHRE